MKALFQVIRTKEDGSGTINGWAIKVNSKKARYAGKYLDHDCVSRASEPQYAGVWATETKAHHFLVKHFDKLFKKFGD